jgi:hypothetical protein
MEEFSEVEQPVFTPIEEKYTESETETLSDTTHTSNPEEYHQSLSLNDSIEYFREEEEQQNVETPSLNDSIEYFREEEEQQNVETPSLNDSIADFKEETRNVEPISLNDSIADFKEKEDSQLNDSIEYFNEEEDPLPDTVIMKQAIDALNEGIAGANSEGDDRNEMNENEPIEEEQSQNTATTEQSMNVSNEPMTDFKEEENIQFEIITQVESVGIDELVFKTQSIPNIDERITEANSECDVRSRETLVSPTDDLIFWNEMKENPPIKYDTPAVIFIVPYRDREVEKSFFEERMESIMQDYPQGYYKIYYIQQNHEKPFNRGAMKNIGFLMVKNKYPEQYKNITLVFNDVDTSPANKTSIPDYSTTRGTIKHFYGYNHVLGGIVSVTAEDFERLNGFPNYYSWGFEDNELKDRADKLNITIDRSVFYPIHDIDNIIQFKQPPERTVNSGEFDRFIRRVSEGINTIYDLYYTVDEGTGMVNVQTFKTKHDVNIALNKEHDTSKSKYPFITGYSAKRRCTMNMVI